MNLKQIAKDMTVREHIAEEIAEFLPEMVRTGIQQANMEQRRQHLERITRIDTSHPSLQPEQQTTSDQNLDNLSN
uniref:Chaperonin-like protein n=1 Tax=Nostoc sp. 'cyanobiont of Peltigera retifoveata' TaxID=2490892 RepID=A0A3G6VBP5_9NOSO|nr:chaperonin-like protein [Nostoc sp. 'cyanobiont of Peltigera retifoveata']